MGSHLKKLVDGLRQTPLHPQWFALKDEKRNLGASCAQLQGTVLDVGCAESKPRAFLPSGATYIGLDNYSTAMDWYDTRPDVLGDAQALPFADSSIDHALLLDVLEHLPQPDRCLKELNRIIKPGGTLISQVPFLYPLHDQPPDFHRWTRHGLRRAARTNGYSIAVESASGHPLETAPLNANIALSKSLINWIRGRIPLMLFAILAPFAILATNFAAWLFAALSRDDDLMPISYRMVWIKN
jgi:SAM-dependent methyltransferase